jgi:hypothetical protein
MEEDIDGGRCGGGVDMGGFSAWEMCCWLASTAAKLVKSRLKKLSQYQHLFLRRGDAMLPSSWFRLVEVDRMRKLRIFSCRGQGKQKYLKPVNFLRSQQFFDLQ